MRLIDRICDTTTSTGTGNLTLAGPVTGFLGFLSSGLSASGNDFNYLIEAVDSNGTPTGDWEVGIGNNPTTTTLQRKVVLRSSNGFSLVNFAAGTKRIHLIASAYQLGWKGAKAFLSGDLTAQNFTTAAAIPWSGTSPDTDSDDVTGTGFWDSGTPTAILVPATGYDPIMVEAFGQVGIALGTASEWIELSIKLNGTVIAKHRFMVPFASATFQVRAPISDLAASDELELFVQTQTDNSITIIAADTFLQLDVKQ